MPSNHFTNLAASIHELKRIYLDDALAAPIPTIEHQEHARAFVTFAHAELEFYAEEALRDLATISVSNAVAGRLGRPSIALLGFSGLPSLNGGSVLSTSNKKPARRLSTRLGEAHVSIVRIINANNGVREKNLAAMAIPLGLDAATIDNTWLNELDAFCSWRGAFSHMSRTNSRASHLAVDPRNVWTKCERLVWTDPTFAVPGTISSFESFDQWVETEKLNLGSVVTVSRWRLRLGRLLISVMSLLFRRKQVNDEVG